MDYPNHITNHEKGKHLSYEDYVIIELRLKDGWKPNAIAKKELNCSGEYRAKHHQEGHDAAVQWQGIPLQGKDRLEGLPGKRASQLPDIRSPGEASFSTVIVLIQRL